MRPARFYWARPYEGCVVPDASRHPQKGAPRLTKMTCQIEIEPIVAARNMIPSVQTKEGKTFRGLITANS